MKVIRESNENEVVLNFLTGELESERFNIKLKKTLKDLKTTEQIITKPNLSNKKENDLRKEVLGEFRGYNKNLGLFENFPNIQFYNLCEFSSEDSSSDNSLTGSPTEPLIMPAISVFTVNLNGEIIALTKAL